MSNTRNMLERQTRTFRLERESENEDGSLNISFSSETDQVERWYGIEILSHAPGAMDMTRAKDGLPFLDQHGRALVGRARDITIGADKKGRAKVYFSSSPEAQQIRRDMEDGIRPDISVGYEPLENSVERGKGNAPDVVTVTRWMPYEISTVMVPADPSVGVGRAHVATDPNPNQDPPAARALAADPGLNEGETGQGTALPTPPTPAQAGNPKEVRTMQTNTDPGAAQAPALSEDQVRQKAVQDTMACREVANRLGLSDLADGMLREGKAVDAVYGAMLERAQSAPLPTAPGIHLSKSEARTYSIAKGILNNAMAQEGNRAFDGIEREVSDEISKHLPDGYKARGGFFVPLQTRALDSATSTGGAELKYTTYGGELIELLRNQSYVAQMGAKIITGLQGPVSFPRQASAGSATWGAENPGNDINDSALALGSVSLAPKTLQSTTAYSRQLLQQAVVDVEMLVRQDLAAIHALAWDLAAIHGAGGSAPTGIYQAASVNAQAFGGVPTFGHLVDMITKVAISNALRGQLGFLTTPGMAGKLAQTLVAQAAGSKMIWDGPFEQGQLAGYVARATNQVSALMNSSAATGGTEHGIIFGNWNELLIGQWGALEILTDPYTKKKQALIEVTSFQMVDIALRHPGSFCKATGATLS